MTNLVGLHDREAVKLTPADTWILDTIGLSENPAPMVYDPKYHWITRVNWGYGSTGTIPKPDKDTEFLFRLSNYVQRSTGNRRWQIGNEPNLGREWPDNQSIHPFRYAEFFTKCADVIHALPGHEKDEVLVAGSGPWNDQYRYQGNVYGDWINYFTDCIGAIPKEKIGGFSIHSYTHGYNPALVLSDATMNSPFQNRHFQFRTYRDYCIAIPDALAHLPIYLTEANGDGPWQATGLMHVMAREINAWNSVSVNRKIKCLIFYRYPKYDHFNIQGKPDVEREYLAAVAFGMKSPDLPNKILLPEVKNMPPEKSLFTTTVTAELLNVRNRPGVTGTMIVGNRAKGANVEVYEETTMGGTPWYRIGKDQWISSLYTAKGQTTPAPTPSSDNWSRAWPIVLRIEGGLSTDRNDTGNYRPDGTFVGTRWGISARSHPTVDIINLSKEDALKIYYQNYWIGGGCDRLQWPLCLLHFDAYVQNQVAAKKFLEVSGGNSILYMAARIDWYTTTSTWDHHGRGWMRRCATMLREIAK
jgi:hypothetical protein